MNFNNVRIPNVPGDGAASALIRARIIGGLGIYGIANSLYNVDGGHRAIVFNRIYGIKNKVFMMWIKNLWAEKKNLWAEKKNGILVL